MKALILTVLFLNLIVSANAAVKEIYREEVGAHTFITHQFKTNQDGRSWIELSLCPTDPEVSCDIVKIKLQGLSYDLAHKEVIFKDEKSSICAREVTRGRGLFRKTLLEMTDDCSFEIKTQKTVIVEDVETVAKNQVVVYFKTK